MLEELMVLSRFRGVLDPSGVVPGATTMTASCGHLCWVSPAGALYLAANLRLRSSCIPCARREGPATVKRAVPGVREEMRSMGIGEEEINAAMHGVTEL